MLTIPNQSSVAKAYQEFDEAGRMRPSAFYERVVDVTDELVKFTLLTCGVTLYVVDRYRPVAAVPSKYLALAGDHVAHPGTGRGFLYSTADLTELA